jgi:hypothetical protein
MRPALREAPERSANRLPALAARDLVKSRKGFQKQGRRFKSWGEQNQSLGSEIQGFYFFRNLDFSRTCGPNSTERADALGRRRFRCGRAAAFGRFPSPLSLDTLGGAVQLGDQRPRQDPKRVFEAGLLQHRMSDPPSTFWRCDASLTIWRTRRGVTHSSSAISS